MTIRLRLYRQQVERLLALPILFLAACGGETTAPPVPALLALGTAHAEIEQWIEAEEAFQRALELDPAEPVTAYNLAVIDFRTGDRAAARAWLDRARSGAPTELTARIELLRGKLAYEDGDEGEEIEAHQAALQADPNEASYAHALAELYLRLGQPEERGVFLQQAHGLWPDNAYLATELALWFLDQTDEALRQQGLALLDSLAGSGADDQITAYLNKGRQELAEAAGVPGPLRIVVNLLRGTQRFQHQAAELQERLEPAAIAIPVGTGSAAAAFPIQPPAVGFASSDLISPPADASGDEIRTVLVVDDSTPRPARARREAGLALLSDRALYTLGPGDRAFEPLADALSSPRKLLAGDIDDDERMELLLLAAGGLRLWDRPTDGEPWAEVSLEPTLANLDDPRQGLLTDFEHDGDLDLLIIQGDGRLVLSTHRGEAGFGPPQKAPLPVDERIRRLAAADLDADADQDLLLVTSTE
ncbi:MAG: FG-GAP-like repeat-containing protein, partial [Acidobacteriota bacterium]